jgi:hypothetical protein
MTRPIAGDRDLNEAQPIPRPNAGPAIWDLVIADMRARDEAGRAKYGTPLQAHNGRDALVDAYQESLDQSVYLRQAIAERDAAGLGGDFRERLSKWGEARGLNLTEALIAASERGMRCTEE